MDDEGEMKGGRLDLTLRISILPYEYRYNRQPQLIQFSHTLSRERENLPAIPMFIHHWLP